VNHGRRRIFVRALAEIRNSRNSGAEEWKVKWEDIIHYPEKMNSPYISGGTVKNAYRRTLTKNRVCIKEESGAFINLMVCKSDVPESITLESEEKSNYDYLLELDIQGQRLFTTRKGYFGISSAKTQVGDLACVLLGGNMPFILRPIDQLDCRLKNDSLFCSFVGQAYVHGIMHGEAIKGRMDKMIFSLC
jgi:hypothetical protein